MNKQISRIAIVALLLLAALIVATTYWQAWAAAGLAARSRTTRSSASRSSAIKRGLIYASDGKTVLARERDEEGRRPDALLPHATRRTGFASQMLGYSTQGRSRAGHRARRRTRT